MLQITGILIFSLIQILTPSLLNGREVELQFHEVKSVYDPDFNELKKEGFSKIIVRSFLNDEFDGGLLFRNDIFKVAYPGFNKIVQQNKKRKFSLWGWLISRNYNWLQNDILYDSKFSKGQRSKIRKLNLFLPVVREKVIAAFKNLAESGVEGILIQDDLSFASNEGFSDRALHVFTEESGVPAKEKLMIKSGTPYNLRWIKIKQRIINEFLTDIVKQCKNINPNIKIGINVYYEASIQQKKGNEWHSQDLEEIVGTGVDHIYLMMYHRQMKMELRKSKEKIKTLFRNGIHSAFKIAGDRLIVKLETWDWQKKEIIPIKEMEEYIALIPEKVKRICFTPVKNADIKYLRQLFKAAKN